MINDNSHAYVDLFASLCIEHTKHIQIKLCFLRHALENWNIYNLHNLHN